MFSKALSRWRDVGIGVVAFLFTIAIFAGIIAMCICALLIMPARLNN